jgi:hypothetical protein
MLFLKLLSTDYQLPALALPALTVEVVVVHLTFVSLAQWIEKLLI